MHDCYTETKQMNSSNTNSGGWTNCAMRTTHLPAIMNLMPAEVKAAIKEVQKKTSAGSQSSSIQTTNDKLFLLSEIEIFGSTTYSFAGEGTQYDYYKAGNSKVKNRSGSANNWWERSPYSSNSTHFCNVYSNGNADATNASSRVAWPSASAFNPASTKHPRPVGCGRTRTRRPAPCAGRARREAPCRSTNPNGAPAPCSYRDGAAAGGPHLRLLHQSARSGTAFS